MRQQLADDRKRERIEWEKKTLVEKRVDQVFNEAFNANLKRLSQMGNMPTPSKLTDMKEQLQEDKDKAVKKIERARKIRAFFSAPMDSYGFSWYICSKVTTV